MTPDLFMLPGDVLGGALLRGWIGPAVDASGRLLDYDGSDNACPVVRLAASIGPIVAIEPHDVSLDTRRTEVQDRIARVLRAGERCGHCHGGSDGDCYWPGCPQLRDGEPERTGRHCPLDDHAPDESCPRCSDTGWLRPPHDIHHLITADLPPAWVAALVWASVAWVEVGARPCGLLEKWERYGVGWARFPISAGALVRVFCSDPDMTPSSAIDAPWRWWALRFNSAPEPKSMYEGGCDVGKAAADAAALAARYALIDGDHIHIPTPDGVRVLDRAGNEVGS